MWPNYKLEDLEFLAIDTELKFSWVIVMLDDTCVQVFTVFRHRGRPDTAIDQEACFVGFANTYSFIRAEYPRVRTADFREVETVSELMFPDPTDFATWFASRREFFKEWCCDNDCEHILDLFEQDDDTRPVNEDNTPGIPPFSYR